MLEIEKFFREKGICKTFDQKDRLYFHNEEFFFYEILSGEIDLYFVEKSSMDGRLYFFRTIKEKGLILSLPKLEKLKIHLIGIPNGRIEICTLKYDILIQAAKESNEINAYILNQTENWINAFKEYQIELPHLTALEKTAKDWTHFHKEVIDLIYIRLINLKESESDLIQRKKEFSDNNFKVALGQLQTVIDEEEIILKPYEKSILFDTCQFVGETLNLSFNPLSKENLALSLPENVSKLCFDSHIFYRVVSLASNWWKKFQGSFLGMNSDKTRPIALIQEKEGYVGIDLEKLTSEKVNDFFLKKVSKHAFEFFRSFPLKKSLSKKDLLTFSLFRKVGIVWGILAISFFMSLLNLFFPFFNQVLFDVVIPIGDRSLLIQILLGMLLITFCNEIFIFSREYMILKFEQQVEREFESAMWQRLLDLPMLFFRKIQIGQLIVRIFSISDIRRMLSGQSTRIIINSLFSLIYLFPMLYYSISLSLVAIATTFLGIIISSWAFIKNVGLYKKLIDLKGKMNDQMLLLLNGIDTIRIFGAEKLVYILWEKIFYPMKRLDWQIQKAETVAHVINFSISSLGILVILTFYIAFMKENPLWLGLSVGQFLAFLAAYGPFSLAAVDLSNVFLESAKLVPLWQKSQILFETPTETDPSKLVLEELRGNIRMDHVSFRYDKNAPFIIENIQLEVKEGEFIGIIGPSGGGKSTLMRLLLGFETPENGVIYFDNKDLATLDLAHVRKQMGVVLQNSTLIDGTIQENISISSFYNEEQIYEALRLAGFEEDLKQLPMGIRTLLMDKGNTLSGGQRQRLLIARALVTKPKILLLDEATSSLDNANQDLITQNLDEIKATRIVITHRLSRVWQANKIYVLNKGILEDAGTFDELARRKGVFASLLEKQKLK